MAHEEPEYISRDEVKRDHGFPDRLIDELLGEPDRYVYFPIPRLSPLPLYLLERVKKAKPLMEAAKQQKADALNQQLKDAPEWAKKTPIRWRRNPPKDAEAAIFAGYQSLRTKHKKSASNDNDEWNPMQRMENIPAADLICRAVNYLRHKKLTYEKVLKERHTKGAAYYEIKRRCLAMIAERYPEFAYECGAQASNPNKPMNP